MDAFSYLASVALRTLALATVAWTAMAVVRVKSPAARHAVWTIVVAGMLAIAAAAALAPPLKVRVLRAQTSTKISPSATAPANLPTLPIPESPAFPWTGAIYSAGMLAFAGRLAYAWLQTRRLVRESRPAAGLGANVRESDAIHVPLTVGFLRPRILLPATWHAWEPSRLESVLVHERTHILRADWAIALLAGVNRCVFWFHPLAWWLEQRLAVLAEHACDDASLAQVASRESYAETLLAMAAAVRSGRVTWEATAMAKTADVRTRVERILDESRRIWPGMTRARWFAVAACAVPLVYLTAALRPARALAQQPDVPAGSAGPLPATNTTPAPQPPRRRLPSRPIHLAYDNNPTPAGQVTVIRGEKIEALNQRIALLQAQLENLLETFTANHPQVRRARAALAALELQQQREQPDPADQQKELQSMLEQLDADMQRLNRTIKPAPQHFTVSTPQPISQSEPQYTAEAKAARIQGTVELSITIGIDGSVQDAKVVRSLDPGLDRQAIECVKLWRYTPMTLDGEKVAATMNVAVTFRIP